MSDKIQTINYMTKFNNNKENKQLHVQHCDFEVEKSRVCFERCPIIADISKSGIEYRLQANSIESLDVILAVPNGVMPKPLLNAFKICETCRLKHNENVK